MHETALRVQSPGYRTTDLYPALRLGVEILQDARYEHRKIVLISDFQQSAFSPALENLQLPGDITVEPIKVGDQVSENKFFENFELSQQRRGDLVSVRFNARMPATGVVTLSIDEENIDNYTGAVPTFQQLVDRPGLYQGYLYVDDPVPGPDDRHYFAYSVRTRSGIFVVDGSPGMRNAFFLESAFDLQDASMYRFDAGPRPARLSAANLLIVTTTGLASARDYSVFENFASSGGTVLLAFDEGSLQQTSLLGAGTAIGLVNARDRQGSDAIIAEIDHQHPIFTSLAQHSTGAVLRPRFRRYVEVIPDSTTNLSLIHISEPMRPY